MALMSNNELQTSFPHLGALFELLSLSLNQSLLAPTSLAFESNFWYMMKNLSLEEGWILGVEEESPIVVELDNLAPIALRPTLVWGFLALNCRNNDQHDTFRKKQGCFRSDETYYSVEGAVIDGAVVARVNLVQFFPSL